MARTYQFLIGRAEAGARLDQFLVRRLPATVSRAMIQRVIRSEGVAVGGRPVKVHYKLRAGDEVMAAFADLPASRRDLDLVPQELPLAVVYEDADVLVVNKPPGLVTHPAPGHWDGTLVNAILGHWQRHPPAAGGVLPRAGILHRLDKDTSGLLLVAKTEAAHYALSKQLKARTLRRRYLAVVEGFLPLETGTISVPIGRHLAHRKQMTVRHLGGREATTHYRLLRRITTPASGRYTVLEVFLETGRTHQIRVHMAHLGHPVAGDTTYGKHPAPYWQALGITRQLLHAYRLTFRHPATGREVTVTAPPPADMTPWL